MMVGVSVGVPVSVAVGVSLGVAVCVKVGVIVGVWVGVAVATQEWSAVLELRALATERAVKSSALLSVSVQPELPRRSELMKSGAGAGPLPSK